MSEFSINEQNKSQNKEMLRVPETQNPSMVEPQAETPQYGQGPTIELENEEVYKLAIKGMREKLVALVQEGYMTEAVAERLLTDFMFNTFNQVVKPKLG